MADLLKINKEQIRESMKRFTWSLNFLAEPKAYVLESFDERREYISKLKETYSLYLITKDGIANYSNGKNITSFAPVSSREEEKFVPEVVIEEMRATGLVPESAEVPVSLAQQYFDLKERLINMGLSEEDINFITSQRLRLYYGNSAEISFDNELSQWISEALEALRIRTCFYQLINGEFDKISTEDLGELSYYIHEHVCHDVKVSDNALRGIARVIEEIENFDQYDEATKVAIIAYLLKSQTQYIEDLGNEFIPENYKEQIIPLINAEVLKTPVVVISSAVNWIIGIAEDPSHGYSQGEYIRFAGIENRDSNGNRIANTTHDIEDWLTEENGFTKVTGYNLSTGEGLEPGDILLREDCENYSDHVAMVIGDVGNGFQYAEATYSEHKNKYGELGDQSQLSIEEGKTLDDNGNKILEEIGLRSFSSSTYFAVVYRYVGV